VIKFLSFIVLTLEALLGVTILALFAIYIVFEIIWDKIRGIP